VVSVRSVVNVLFVSESWMLLLTFHLSDR